MAYTDVKYPKTWRVKDCSNEELGLQKDDLLLLEGSGNGGASSTLFKLQGEVRTPWGFGCAYSDEGVKGSVDPTRQFSLKFGTSCEGKPIVEGEVSSKPESVQESVQESGQESGSNPGSGSWTAEQGG